MAEAKRSLSVPAGVQVSGPVSADFARILTPEALAFLATLTRHFRARVEGLLGRRKELQARFDAGARPDFLSETVRIRQGEWQAAPLPPDLVDRRVEITGPPVRKMIINALNSGAHVYMADFEDSCAPTWQNLLEGQVNLFDAVRRTIRVDDDGSGKTYVLGDKLATLVVRPRGWHLWEPRVRVDDGPVPGALFDFGLYFFHNAKALLEAGTGPYFYLPKLQGHLEARLWNEVFVHAQDAMGLTPGTIRATVLIETLPAAFEMDEIIYELRDHIAGLNCGRWDYIFSFIKTLRRDPAAVLPDRRLVTMAQPCMQAYSKLLVQTCHRRGIHGMGGMAAQIPIKDDPAANERALESVRADKLREVQNGHDGTWVAHPGLVSVAREIFDAHMPEANQIKIKWVGIQVLQDDLLQVPQGARTEAGLRHNVDVGVQYLEAWLGGNGCVPIHHLMEDAATAEISRSQVWQWLHHRAPLEGGKVLDSTYLRQVIDEEMGKIRQRVGDASYSAGHYEMARQLFEQLVSNPELEDFLTLPASAHLATNHISD
ncbi:MAG TPA: malate synthase A [Myxococcota bacterium]|nr:malate synthase A [Myxococcota bacterium]